MKLRKISDITATLPFTEFDFMQKYRESFAVSEIGHIYAQLPLKEMAEKIRSHFHKTHHQGNTPLFPPEGEVALKERLPRNKYHDINRARLVYAKQRKQTKAATNKLRRRLFALLCKQIGQWDYLCMNHTIDIKLTAEQSKRLAALKEVFRQKSALAQKREVKHRPTNYRHTALQRHGWKFRK